MFQFKSSIYHLQDLKVRTWRDGKFRSLSLRLLHSFLRWIDSFIYFLYIIQFLLCKIIRCLKRIKLHYRFQIMYVFDGIANVIFAAHSAIQKSRTYVHFYTQDCTEEKLFFFLANFKIIYWKRIYFKVKTFLTLAMSQDADSKPKKLKLY